MSDLDTWVDNFRTTVLFMDECDVCGMLEERILTDSWTGKEICLSCWGEIIDEITNSPASEGDNLVKVLKEHDMLDEDEDDELG